MRAVGSILFILVLQSAAQATSIADDFSITLERVGCLGSCPDYKITIAGDGLVRYEGRAYVRIEGIHDRRIPARDVQKLVQKLRDQDFFGGKKRDRPVSTFPRCTLPPP